MDEKAKRRVQLDCLYEMFRDKIDENVVYIVYTENDGKIDKTIDHLMSIAACSFTGHYFEAKCSQDATLTREPSPTTATSTANLGHGSPDLHKNNGFTTHSNGYSSKSGEPNSNKYPDKDTRSLSPSSELEASGEDDKLTLEQKIEKLQTDIDNLLMEKKSSHDKAKQYLTRKMFPVTSYYSDVAGQLRMIVERKTKQLVGLLLQKSENANYVDLHGLNPIQARLVVSELLNIRQSKLMIDKQGEASIDIITGWGKHCVTNGQRIRPAIVDLLKEKGFEFYHLNKGALRVTIRR